MILNCSVLKKKTIYKYLPPNMTKKYAVLSFEQRSIKWQKIQTRPNYNKYL